MNTFRKAVIIAILLIVCIFIGGLISRQSHRNTLNSKAAEIVSEHIRPTPTIFVPGQIKVQTMDSPDGAASFSIESQQFETYVRSWFFYTSAADQHKTLIFSEDRQLTKQLSIPHNTWSPDNKYIFLQTTDSGATSYIVFSARGELFTNDVRYLKIDELFAAQLPGYTITDVTGWAAPDLLIVNTTANVDESQVSFWFDVSSQSFIRLTTYFR